MYICYTQWQFFVPESDTDIQGGEKKIGTPERRARVHASDVAFLSRSLGRPTFVSLASLVCIYIICESVIYVIAFFFFLSRSVMAETYGVRDVAVNCRGVETLGYISFV